MVRSIKGFVIAFGALALISTTLWGGTTGKISGRVVDESTGNPLIGANVVIVGTNMGAAADAEGDYFIINVPPGPYDVSVSMIGYQAVTQTDVIVRIDHTTPVDFELSSTVLQAEAVTVTAEREVVKMDQSSSVISASYEEIQAVPVLTDISDYLALQAGFQGNEIRGGGWDQTEFMMDGLVVVDNRTNQPMMMVNLSAVQELNVITGGFNAEYGNVRSGLINIVTKEGSATRYSGSVDLRYTPAIQKHWGPSFFDPDNYFLRSFLDPAVAFVGTANGTWTKEEQLRNIAFEGWNAVSEDRMGDADPDNDVTPEEAQQIFIWEHTVEAKEEWNIPSAESLGHPKAPRTYADIPEYNYDLSLGGPVPILNRFLPDLSFFLSHRKALSTFTYPSPSEDNDQHEEQNTQLKLTTQLTPNIKILLEGLFGKTTSLALGNVLGPNATYGTGNLYWVSSGTPSTEERSMLGFGIDHVLSANTYYNLRLSYTTNEVFVDAWRPLRVRDSTIIKYIGTTPMIETPYGYVHDRIVIDPNMYMGGEGPNRVDRSSVATLHLNFDLTSQINKYHQIKAGFMFISDNMTQDQDRDVYVQPDLTSPEKWTHTPIRMGAYLQDKLEFEGMIANIGLRIDANNPNTDWVDFSADPDDPSWPDNGPYSKYMALPYRDAWIDSMPEELEVVPAEGHVKISPRIGISHPISENAKLVFNYGHFYSMPGSSSMYRIEVGSPVRGVSYLGNPSVDMPQTISYEMALEYDLRNSILIHIKGYYKDVSEQVGNVSYQSFDGSTSYSTAANKNYEDIRGLELRIDKRAGRWITGWLNYDYMVQTSGDVGRTTNYEDPAEQRTGGLENPVQDRPLPRPTLRANLTFRTPADLGPSVGGISLLGGWSTSFLYTWRAGSYLTWDPLEMLDEENNLQWISRGYTDLRISRTVRIAGAQISLFADITNVFVNKYLSGGFSGTQDREDYYGSLHLPMYEDEIYQGLLYWSEKDMETSIQYPVHPKGFDAWSTEVAGDITDEIPDWWDGTAVYDAGDDVTTLTSVSRDFNDKLGEKATDDKPYINMPNQDYNTYSGDPRNITFGLRVAF